MNTSSPSQPDDEFSPEEQKLFEMLNRRLEEMHQSSAVGRPVRDTAEIDDPDDSGQAGGLLDCLAGLERLAEFATGPAVSETMISGEDLREPAVSDSMLAKLPRDLGPYELLREIGRGGMGIVFRARHRKLEANVAIKVIRSSDWASADQVRRFLREARAASRLRHPNIVTVHDVGESEGLHYLAMQWIEGENLAERLAAEGISPESAVSLMIDVAGAVDYLHRKGVVHRDLKPANIMLDNQNRPFVTDFGLAKVFDYESTRTTASLIVGTPAYMAPEQAWGPAHDVTGASDIYSLGCILYEMLTGRPPFPEKNALDLLLRLRDSEPLPPRRVRRSIPADLELIVLKCLEKDPQRRYATAADLQQDLLHLQRGEPISVTPSDLWRRLYRWSRSEPALVSRIVAITIMALIVQGAEWAAGHHRPQYIPEISILSGWMIASVVLQKLLNLNRSPDLIRLIWVVVDTGCFTAALAWAEKPMESLVIGYSLMIVTSALWWRPRLIWTVTVTSVLAYLGLVAFRGTPETPAHYPFIVVGVLGVLGAVMAGLLDYLLSVVRSRTEQ